MNCNNNDITIIILTKNEESNMVRCLTAAKTVTNNIIVVDSGSTDKTLEIAKSFNCQIFTHEFISYAHQYDWVLKNIKINSKWIFRLDADEIVTPKLADEIIFETKKHEFDDVNGFVLSFRIYFLGKLIKHAALYPFLNLCIWKNGKGSYSLRYMGEHVILSEGKTIQLKNYCEHHDMKTLSIWVKKHEWYSTREVVDYFERRGTNETDKNLYANAKKTQKIRDGFYYRLPSFFRARLYYWYRYFIKLGFLDGRPGKIYCWLQAYWYRFLVDAKIYEAELCGFDRTEPGDLK